MNYRSRWLGGRLFVPGRRAHKTCFRTSTHPSTLFHLGFLSIFALTKMAQPRAQAVRPAAAAPAQDEGIVKKLQPIIRSIAMFMLIQTGTSTELSRMPC
jgi:hypothetical protein